MTTQPTRPDLFEVLRTLELPAGDYAVFGSGPLIIRGIIPLENDLDVIARGAAWDRARCEGTLIHLPEHGVDVASFLNGRITIGRSWAYGMPDIDALIDAAELIDGEGHGPLRVHSPGDGYDGSLHDRTPPTGKESSTP